MKQSIILCLLLCLTFVYRFSAQEIEHAHSMYHSMIENKGQWNDQILFQSKFDGGNLWIQQNKFVFHLRDFSEIEESHGNFKFKGEPTIKQTVLHCNFLGSNNVTEIEKLGPTPSNYNYFLGNDESKWASYVRGYSEVILRDYYDGIHMKLIENELDMKYEFHVQPQIDPNQIQLEYVGHEKISIDKNGNLRLRTELGEVIENKPFAYQIKNGRIVEIACKFVVTNNVVTFDLEEYDENIELIIDPILVFATYAGSVTDNFGMTATYASDGSAYSGGVVYGNAYPTPDNLAYDITSNFTVANVGGSVTTDVFLTKYSADGTNMIWTTFIGGGNDNSGTETVHSLIADSLDNLYCYGATSSTDFPMQGGAQILHAGGTANLNITFNGVNFGTQGTDIYVAKISANGQNLLGSTFLGGSGNDGVNYDPAALPYNNVGAYSGLRTNYGDQFRGEVMLDAAGNCIVASCTRSIDFPTTNPFQSSNAGGQDGVVFKLNSSLSTVLWSSYYGGTADDACYSVKVDTNQNIVFAGGTNSNDLPNTSGWQPIYNGGSTDGFVAKVSGDGQSFNGASYIGTSNYDQAFFVEIDRNNNIFLVGQSAGGTFPVTNANYSNPGSSQFIVKLPYDLSAPLNSTVFGNGNANINISPSAFLVDVCGNVYVSGWGANILQATQLSGMPTTLDALYATSPNGFDFYLFVIDRLFDTIVYGSYIGGNQAQEHVDGGTSRFDNKGVVYQSVCGGCTGFSDFQTTPNAWSSQNLSQNCNNLVFKFDFQLTPEANFSLSDTAICVGEQISLTNNSPASDEYFWILPNGDTSFVFEPVLSFPNPGTYTVKLIITDSICNLADTSQIDVVVEPQINLTTSNDTALCSIQSFDIWANSFGTATYFVWSSDINFGDTLNNFPMDSIITVSSAGLSTYYVQAGNDNCSNLDSVQVAIVDQSLSLVDEVSYCLGDPNPDVTVVNQTPSVLFTHVWTPTNILAGSNTGPTVTINAPTSQYLYLESTSNLGCVVNDSVWIEVQTLDPSSVFITYAPNDTVPEGGFVTLTANPAGLSYQWLPANDVTEPNEQVTQTQVDNPKEITLIVSSGACSASAKQKLYNYEFVCDNSYVYVPNAFSPNGDGENDVLFVRSIVTEEILFRVFNRWGEMVFETTDASIGWDGKFRNKLMDPDVYDYYLKAICVDGQERIQKGNVTLIR